MDKRLRWFDEGAAALRRVVDKAGHGDDLPASADCYACPCCLGLYDREAVASRILTLEDVPPKALGGRPSSVPDAAKRNVRRHLASSDGVTGVPPKLKSPLMSL
jgi:hypothetical protein